MSSPLYWTCRATRPINQPEAQRTGNRRRFDELDGNRIAEPVRVRAADESAAGFVKAKIFLADVARRNETIRSGFIEFNE